MAFLDTLIYSMDIAKEIDLQARDRKQTKVTLYVSIQNLLYLSTSTSLILSSPGGNGSIHVRRA